MTTLTVKLNAKQAAKISRWARLRKSTKSDVLRELIDRSGPIETGDDLADWVKSAEGKGMGFAPKPGSPSA